jgi:elongation factor P
MVTASELKAGMALRIDHQIYKVIEVESRAGTAKMGGNVRALLSNVHSGRLWDQHFRPLERLDDVDLEKRKVEFLYTDEGNCIFQRLDSFEQFEFPSAGMGLAEKFLQPGTEVQAEFFGDELIGIVLPETVEVRIASTQLLPHIPSRTRAEKKPRSRMASPSTFLCSWLLVKSSAWNRRPGATSSGFVRSTRKAYRKTAEAEDRHGRFADHFHGNCGRDKRHRRKGALHQCGR